jgi:hypothetical protein
MTSWKPFFGAYRHWRRLALAAVLFPAIPLGSQVAQATVYEVTAFGDSNGIWGDLTVTGTVHLALPDWHALQLHGDRKRRSLDLRFHQHGHAYERHTAWMRAWPSVSAVWNCGFDDPNHSHWP